MPIYKFYTFRKRLYPVALLTRLNLKLATVFLAFFLSYVPYHSQQTTFFEWMMTDLDYLWIRFMNRILILIVRWWNFSSMERLYSTLYFQASSFSCPFRLINAASFLNWLDLTSNSRYAFAFLISVFSLSFFVWLETALLLRLSRRWLICFI